MIKKCANPLILRRQQKQSLNNNLIFALLARLSPIDLECLTVFLTYSSHKEWNKLNMWCCFIQDHGLQTLQHGLRSSNVTIIKLLLYDNNLTEISSSAISDLTVSCRAKTLSVSGNETVGEDAKLYRIISDNSSTLEELYTCGLPSYLPVQQLNCLPH